MHLGEFIKKYRDTNGISMGKFAELSGLSKAYVSVLEKNSDPRNNKPITPSIHVIKKVSDVIDIPFDELFSSLDDDIIVSFNENKPEFSNIYTSLEEKRQENVLTYAKQQLAEQRQEQAKKSNVIEFNKADEINEELYPYNVTEKSAAAKSLSRGYSYNPDFNETFTVYSDYKTSKHYDIATQVVGDSMEPKYPDGDIVLIQKGYDNWNGGVYVVDYDGMTYLKKVFLEENQFRLVSINPKYDDIIIDVPVDEDIYFNIVGRVVDSFTPVER